MPRSKPYQPSLLRFLHGVNALIALLAIITAFWVYNTFDGRLIKLPLPEINDIIGIHGTFGVAFLLMMPAFALYSFHLGHKRLVQSDSLTKLTQIGKPIWWYSLHRIVNTVMLIAATWALITGRMMKEEWLPIGELDHIWYQLHLAGWVILVVCLIMHLLLSIKVGGLPLIVSMFEFNYRPEDSPATWLQQIRSFFSRS
ncbi:cytochrome b/b6 domain-containing protein [Allocoleopsis franciscana]|uniref:Prokaryotic cytochrome b561 n=1 Tax=Allocoleopsis franciscana PCC 7113 TaxID=1173027 RepID=K9WM14_9CYAN|nr:cytochrome b/b6 domain-containing protein [Allocoleopsis franciscana]AFZ21223.1 Prokaryotic cytochrome b561 [Allocoleopsis franciscana PCC 7113]